MALEPSSYRNKPDCKLNIELPRTIPRLESEENTHLGQELKKKTLSKFIWTNKLNCNSDGEMIEPPIQWSILKKSHTYKPGQKHCNLCLSEKLLILQNINKPHNINKRTDLASICIHKHKHFLASVI